MLTPAPSATATASGRALWRLTAASTADFFKADYQEWYFYYVAEHYYYYFISIIYTNFSTSGKYLLTHKS